MWEKGKEITKCWPSPYSGSVYENAYGGGGSITPAGAISGWKSSNGHNELMSNSDIWRKYNPWPAMGIGIEGRYAVLIFGDRPDATGEFQPSGGGYKHCGPEDYRPAF
jgi:hypothetical protein